MNVTGPKILGDKETLKKSENVRKAEHPRRAVITVPTTDTLVSLLTTAVLRIVFKAAVNVRDFH